MRQLTIKGKEPPAAYPVRRMNVYHEVGLTVGRQALPHRAANRRGVNPAIRTSNQFFNVPHKFLNLLRLRLHSLPKRLRVPERPRKSEGVRTPRPSEFLAELTLLS